ncbi:MAG TPA: hypothetical protein VNQ33_08960 [Acidimicrobiales bacterium]|nr:hypothetical protein [Acidimicrobiales bacterium]
MSAAPNETRPTFDENSPKDGADRSLDVAPGSPARCHSRHPTKATTVTLRAQCHACTGWFDLARLYAADPCDADRCPNCAAHLGSAGLGHTTFRIERHLKALCAVLGDLAESPGAFTVDSSAVRIQVLRAVDRLDEPPALNATTRISATTRR